MSTHNNLHLLDLSLSLDEQERPQTIHELARLLLTWTDGPIPRTDRVDPIRTTHDERLADLIQPGGAMVVMTEGAIQAHGEATKFLMDASLWAENVEILWSDAETNSECIAAAGRETEHRRRQVADMQASYWRCMAHLLTVPQHHDGQVVVSRDGEACFFWRYPKSGYHGGIVFHASYANKGTERLPVGTWSIHT